MKKLIVFIFLLIIVAICSLGKEIKFFDLNLSFTAELFVTDISNNIKGEVIKNGEGYIVKANENSFNAIMNEVGGIYGVTFIFDEQFSTYESLKEDVKIQNIQEDDNYCTFYGYITGQDKFLFLNGKKVNIQVAYDDIQGKLIVGYPIILGSY